MFIISLAKVGSIKARELFLSSVRLESRSVDVFDNRELS